MTNLEDALGGIDILADTETTDTAPTKSALDDKINEHFAGAVVRKDLVKAVKGNAIVPSYVLEYLLGQYAASDDEATIQAGIETVRKILAEHYVHRNESELVKSKIKERGRYRIIDKVSAALNEKDDVYQATFANLGISGVIVDSATVGAHPKLLVGGVWCLCDVEYFHTEDARVSPWILGSLKPIQMSNFDYDGYLDARAKFTTDEWIDLLLQSIGFDPEMFGRRGKLLQLVRLIPFVERNYNLVELGPKGTGKSHIYSEFSPHGMLISGGEVTVPKLFVNNSNGRLGLVGYWDVVAFDEFAGKKKRTDKALVDIMKNYMANKSFSRGVETLGAEASMVFVGNTSHTVPYMLKHSDLFDELPESYHDPAFLDRLHFYIPGWEVDTIRSEMFSSGYGFVVDYIAEVLKSMRNLDYSDRYQQYFTLGSDISTRDRDGIHKTFSGLMKLLYPHEQATAEEVEEILRFAIEGRKRVKDQILRIDATMADVRFGYEPIGGGWKAVMTLEEDEFPTYYRSRRATSDGDGADADTGAEAAGADEGDEGSLPRVDLTTGTDVQIEFEVPAPKLFEGHRDFAENQRGLSYETLLMPYLEGAAEIELHDPYVRMSHQGRNLVELLAMIASAKDPADEINFKLFTLLEEEPEYQKKQLQMLNEIVQGAAQQGIKVDVAKDPGGHDRWIRTDTGWRINLGRGLDIFQKSDGGWFDFASSRQEFRQVRAFGVTYIREG
ncbi:BREX system Lon protease-like protein BrxL [Corynebacterium sanguinis]|uniref:BREX system Lon protease-like protein BrxL n=1 Tax=Corynebacterium sanguinis TaxID=2594913 RepID=UPI0021A975D7|nr:BREX system Lon protease-like protein BrxL [Corynebacterium sanguinis]MCT2252996.1 BREX system Lon protease-like protein BrxL [Corynebacterium sanguinis]